MEVQWLYGPGRRIGDELGDRPRTKDAQYRVVTLPGRTPVLVVDIPGAVSGNIILYGHLDKQPEMTGWDADLGPWKPVIRDDRLYGRGGADDGYALFASLTAITTLREQNIAHPRCYLLIECCEESGSFDLPPYIEHLTRRSVNPTLFVWTPEPAITINSGAPLHSGA